MPLYRRSLAQETVVILRAIRTTTTIAAYGSGDGFTTPGTEFGDDEEIMISGTVVADDAADLTGQLLEISIDGVPVGTTGLFGYDGLTNYYQLNIGMLAEGTHVIEAMFLRVRI